MNKSKLFSVLNNHRTAIKRIVVRSEPPNKVLVDIHCQQQGASPWVDSLTASRVNLSSLRKNGLIVTDSDLWDALEQETQRVQLWCQQWAREQEGIA